ncbi:MAG: hypothetical protein ACLFSK_09450 [Ectothiorhodospira sp.]
MPAERPSTIPALPRAREIVEWYLKGRSVKGTAEDLGLSHHQVYRVVTAAGVVRRPRDASQRAKRLREAAARETPAHPPFQVKPERRGGCPGFYWHCPDLEASGWVAGASREAAHQRVAGSLIKVMERRRGQ